MYSEFLVSFPAPGLPTYVYCWFSKSSCKWPREGQHVSKVTLLSCIFSVAFVYDSGLKYDSEVWLDYN